MCEWVVFFFFIAECVYIMIICGDCVLVMKATRAFFIPQDSSFLFSSCCWCKNNNNIVFIREKYKFIKKISHLCQTRRKNLLGVSITYHNISLVHILIYYYYSLCLLWQLLALMSFNHPLLFFLWLCEKNYIFFTWIFYI